jgi:putative NIF3 family GTP cyclohydrolase 1 type 2
LTVYPTRDVILAAARDKFDLIITYSLPDVWSFNQITDELYQKMKVLLESRIYLYAIPKEWIFVKSGFIELISELLELEVVDVFQNENPPPSQKIIGRICQIKSPSLSLSDVLTQIKAILNAAQLQYSGDLNSSIQKILLTFEHPLSIPLLKSAKRANIDTIICDNYTFELEKTAEELELNLINVTLNIINLGLLKLTQALRLEHLDIDFVFMNLPQSSKFY